MAPSPASKSPDGRRDPAMDEFVKILQKHMKTHHITSAQLADEIGIYKETVENMRKGRANPRLRDLSKIAIFLGVGGDSPGNGNPLELLRQMGVLEDAGAISDGLVREAFRLQQLELKVAEAMDRAASLGSRHGASAIVRAVCESQDWAVAVWPAIHGPKTCRMHVADRVDFRKRTGAGVTDQEVWDDYRLNKALRASYAFPASAEPRWSSSSNLAVSTWSINHIGSPRTPDTGLLHPKLSGLVFVAFTHASFVDEVASMVASAIGYGLTTTHDLALEIYGSSLGSTSTEARLAVHRKLLERPHKRRAWSHFGPPGADSDGLIPSPAVAGKDMFYVWLREDDALLERGVARFSFTIPSAYPDIDTMMDARTLMTQQLADQDFTGQNLIIDVHANSADTASQEQDARWKQALDNTLTVLRALKDRGFIDPHTIERKAKQLESRDPGTTGPLFSWLAANGWP